MVEPKASRDATSAPRSAHFFRSTAPELLVTFWQKSQRHRLCSASLLAVPKTHFHSRSLCQLRHTTANHEDNHSCRGACCAAWNGEPLMQPCPGAAAGPRALRFAHMPRASAAPTAGAACHSAADAVFNMRLAARDFRHAATGLPCGRHITPHACVPHTRRQPPSPATSTRWSSPATQVSLLEPTIGRCWSAGRVCGALFGPCSGVPELERRRLIGLVMSVPPRSLPHLVPEVPCRGLRQ